MVGYFSNMLKCLNFFLFLDIFQSFECQKLLTFDSAVWKGISSTEVISHNASRHIPAITIMANVAPDYDKAGDDGCTKVKVICLGDSAVGKSKLVERFLMDGYKPQQLSTFALTLFNYETEINKEKVSVDFWDTAGQERFNNMHPSYYHQAHACIIVFDTTRKITYKNLPNWLKELREYRPEIPCLCAANKIDVDVSVTTKSFNFAKKHNMPFYFCSASDGTNVVRLFKDAIRAAVAYKNNSTDFMDEIMRELENFELETDKKDNEVDSGLDSTGNSDEQKQTAS